MSDFGLPMQGHAKKFPSLTLEGEKEWLAEQARKVSSIVEIGAFQGGTTKILLENCKGFVWVIDPWEIITEHFVKFAENMQNYQNLIIMKMPSIRASKLFAENSVDMVFIDGDHRYPMVKADIKNWLPKTRALFCGHDYGHPNNPGVKYAVDKLVPKARIHEMIWYKWLT